MTVLATQRSQPLKRTACRSRRRGHGRRRRQQSAGAAAGGRGEEVAGGPARGVRRRRRQPGAQLRGAGRRARLRRRARPRRLLAPRARPRRRRGGEVARRSDRDGGGLRDLGGGVRGGGRAHGHRRLQHVLLLAGRPRRTRRWRWMGEW